MTDDLQHENVSAIVNRVYPGARLAAVERLTGGVSADVYRLDLQLADGQPRSIVLRAHGASHSGHSAELEYQLLSALHVGGVAVPEPMLMDVSGEVLNPPFLVMSFVAGSSSIASQQVNVCIDKMADTLHAIHDLPTDKLPTLPQRTDPLPEVFDFLPPGAEWDALRAHLHTLTATRYTGPPQLLHGDFWPENMLWQQGEIVAVLDWEDAAVGDPLSDVAACGVELRYKYGQAAMQRFTRAYARQQPLDVQRLALWRVYVASAAQRYMGDWGLDAAYAAHMRAEALASIGEAGAVLMSQVAEQ